MSYLYNYCLYNEGKYQSEIWDVSCPLWDTVPDEVKSDWACSAAEDGSWEQQSDPTGDSWKCNPNATDDANISTPVFEENA
jgi:hypothetical protein